MRPNAENRLVPILVSLKDIEDGKAEMTFLNPGDQVVIGKEGFSMNTILDALGKISVFRLLVPF